MRPIITTAFMAALCFATGPALSPAVANERISAIASAPANVETIANETTLPQSNSRSGSEGAQGSLSHELSRSSGVIHPPPSGDHSVVQPPMQDESRMPVIPPPGTPGGNPLVHPK